MNNKTIFFIVPLCTMTISCAQTGPSDSQAEAAAAVMSTLTTQTGTIAQSSSDSLRADPAAAFSATTDTATVSCPVSGSATLGMTITLTDISLDTTSEIDFDYEYTAELTDCVAKGSDDVEYTFNGSTKVTNGTAEYKFTTEDDGSTTIDGTFVGPITGTVDITGGTTDLTDCELDYTTTSKLEGTSPDYTYTTSWEGSVCGSSIDGSYEFSL